MDGMQQALLDLIGPDANRRAQQWRKPSRHARDGNLDVRQALQPAEYGLIDHQIDQGLVHRTDRAKWTSAPPSGPINVAPLRSAPCQHEIADSGANAEERIDASQGASADSHDQPGR